MGVNQQPACPFKAILSVGILYDLGNHHGSPRLSLPRRRLLPHHPLPHRLPLQATQGDQSLYFETLSIYKFEISKLFLCTYKKRKKQFQIICCKCRLPIELKLELSLVYYRSWTLCVIIGLEHCVIIGLELLICYNRLRSLQESTTLT